MKTIFRKTIVEPVVRLLSQGMAPGRIALSMAVALSLSVIPVLGVTTGLCFAAAFAFRLNVAAMQLVNMLATPLQLALLLPFYRAGANLIGVTPLSVSPASLMDSFRTSPAAFFESLWQQMLAGTLVWFLISIPTVWILAPVLRSLINRLLKSEGRVTVDPAGVIAAQIEGHS
jgi:uncharacterized protein (DUF2062 family)